MRIYVVEPYAYEPKEHAAVFNAAITSLVAPQAAEIDSALGGNMALNAEPFDLITFPEAFLPSSDLLIGLSAISGLPSCGCIHVGLRPTSDAAQHLFSVAELNTLVHHLQQLQTLVLEDLAPFSKWLVEQTQDRLFNIGCLFAIDLHSRLRVCLHPKIVKSKFEIGMSHEMNMHEADMLTLVTLVPKDKRMRSITIQPLLCSDVLNLDTDRPSGRPLYAVNDDTGTCFGENCPEHVDVVSLATCTPQQKYQSPTGPYYQWHPEFQDAFRRSATDDELSKHHHSLFVLSNFRTVTNGKLGGLSGAFIPVPLSGAMIPTYLTVSVFGHSKSYKEPDRWSHTADEVVKDNELMWKSLGHVASLRNTNSETVARMIGFTVSKLPREASLWRPHTGLVNFQLFVAVQNASANQTTFKRQTR